MKREYIEAVVFIRLCYKYINMDYAWLHPVCLFGRNGRGDRATLYCSCPCLIYERRETRLDLQRGGEQVPVWGEGQKGH